MLLQRETPPQFVLGIDKKFNSLHCAIASEPAGLVSSRQGHWALPDGIMTFRTRESKQTLAGEATDHRQGGATMEQ